MNVNSFRRLRLLASLFIVVPLAVQADAPPRIDSLIRDLMAKGDVSGLSIVAVHGDEIAWHQAYGLANADTRAPLTDRSIFEAASLGKPVFGYAVLKLADAGVIDLDVPLHRYLPEPVSDERIKLITARMVLSHTTGFQNEVLPGQTLTVHFTPGARFSYSGAGFLYLERVVEHVTKKDLGTLMRELVFEPLGMRDSGYVWIPEYETRQVYGHRASGAVAERRKPSTATMAMLHTTPLDFARFAIALMRGEGLKRSTSRAMSSTQTSVDAGCYFCLTQATVMPSPSLSWGLAVGLEKTARGTAFWHWGENNGEFQNFVMGYPQGDGVVIFTNSGNGFSIMPEIVTAVLGGEHPAFAWMRYDHYDAPAKVFLREMLRSGAEVALKNPIAGTLTEQQLNAAGYTLLQRGRTNEAILVFTRNVERFPSSANVYDSLGEAFAAAGDKEKAIANYQRSLDLDPKNTNAEEMLRKLKAAS